MRLANLTRLGFTRRVWKGKGSTPTKAAQTRRGKTHKDHGMMQKETDNTRPYGPEIVCGNKLKHN